MLRNFLLEFGTRVAHLNCSYFSNLNTRGACNVVVSASDWHAGGPGLIPRRNKPDIFGIKTNRQRLTLLNFAAGGAMLCATHIGMPPT